MGARMLDFTALETEGKTVVNTETTEDVSPGEGWEKWSTIRDEYGTIKAHVWRKVMTFAEAEAWAASQEPADPV